jgi:ABC-type transporter Mla subunit MlaD
MWVPWTRHVDQRFNRLEAAMADVDKALTDLAEAVQKIGTNLQDAIQRVTEDVAELQRQVAAGDPTKLQAVADAIEAKVAELGGVADTLADIDPVKPTPPPVPEPPA